MFATLSLVSVALLLPSESPSDFRLPSPSSPSRSEYRMPESEAPREPLRLSDGMILGEEQNGTAYGLGTFRTFRARRDPSMRGVGRDRSPRGGLGAVVRWSF